MHARSRSRRVPWSRAVSVAESLDRLRAAADDGRLDDVAHRYGVALITVFGSAIRTPQRARDLDVAVSLPAGTDGLLALVGELADLTASDDVDVLVIDDASPTARRNWSRRRRTSVRISSKTSRLSQLATTSRPPFWSTSMLRLQKPGVDGVGRHELAIRCRSSSRSHAVS